MYIQYTVCPQVTPDNDVQRVVDSAMTTIQQDETVIKAIQGLVASVLIVLKYDSIVQTLIV